MILRNLRWGDNRYFVPAPLAETCIAQVTVTDEEHNYFITILRNESIEEIFISELPLYDLVMESSLESVDHGYEHEKLEKYSVESYSYIFLSPEDSTESYMRNSRFAKAIQLARLSIMTYSDHVYDNPGYITEKLFIEDYVEIDLNDIELPPVYYKNINGQLINSWDDQKNYIAHILYSDFEDTELLTIWYGVGLQTLEYNCLCKEHPEANRDSLAIFEVSREFADELECSYNKLKKAKWAAENPKERNNDSRDLKNSLAESEAEFSQYIRKLFRTGKIVKAKQ